MEVAIDVMQLLQVGMTGPKHKYYNTVPDLYKIKFTEPNVNLNTTLKFI